MSSTTLNADTPSSVGDGKPSFGQGSEQPGLGSESETKLKTDIEEDEEIPVKRTRTDCCAEDADAGGAAQLKKNIEVEKNAELKKQPFGVGAMKDGKDSYEFFYGKNSPFSQHYQCHFKIEGHEFNCAEQYMMYMKAVVFKDTEMMREILKTSNPVLQKRFGRKVKNFDGVVWNSKCEKIVWDGNYAKFSQNPKLKSSLLATAQRTLVEASGRDRKWGIGLGPKNPKAWNRSTWRGQNKLGFILTRIRDKLRASSSSSHSKAD